MPRGGLGNMPETGIPAYWGYCFTPSSSIELKHADKLPLLQVSGDFAEAWTSQSFLTFPFRPHTISAKPGLSLRGERKIGKVERMTN
ncbi:unnamed protein product [Tuber melanosporum]|uniref:(Perigord truffle) hypothetical protein n=1 Tax=Tuber melanosporum (strain Mel28) TaxID=656061 RepID=D5GPM8_TUBMM|nr:uncharacterized protein GSTUM_00011938001 [Tuber melanosporum]CAZ86471.1 unnamed protein product [Tuber melanosporum]